MPKEPTSLILILLITFSIPRRKFKFSGGRAQKGDRHFAVSYNYHMPNSMPLLFQIEVRGLLAVDGVKRFRQEARRPDWQNFAQCGLYQSPSQY